MRVPRVRYFHEHFYWLRLSLSARMGAALAKENKQGSDEYLVLILDLVNGGTGKCHRPTDRQDW